MRGWWACLWCLFGVTPTQKRPGPLPHTHPGRMLTASPAHRRFVCGRSSAVPNTIPDCPDATWLCGRSKLESPALVVAHLEHGNRQGPPAHPSRPHVDRQPGALSCCLRLAFGGSKHDPLLSRRNLVVWGVEARISCTHRGASQRDSRLGLPLPAGPHIDHQPDAPSCCYCYCCCCCCCCCC